MSILKTITGLLIAAVLTACGGGGGESGNSGSSSSAGTGTTTGTTGTGTNAAVPTATLQVTLQNSSGTSVNSIGIGSNYYAKAVLTDGSGAPIANKVITFSLNSTIATLSSITALTDSTGVTNLVGLAPTAGAASGAATLSVSATVSNATVSGSIDFSSTGAGTSAVTITASVTDAGGVVVNSIGSSGYKAKALVKDGSGVPVPGKLVSFGLNSALATLTSSSALTDSNGIATVGISSATGSAAGAATLTVNTTVSGVSLSSTTDFAFSGAVITLSSINAGTTSLSSGGNTSLSLTALIGGIAAGATPVNITFTASCGSVNGSIGSAGVTTDGSGVALVNYSAVNSGGTPCAGAVTIGATTGSVSATPLTLTVANPTATSVAYVSATLNQIYVSGSGAPTDSVVTFKVLTSTGTPSTNTAVTFSIPSNPGGVVLGTVTGTTDNSGLVTVKVSAGAIPGPLKVRASISGGAYSESQNLTVASGPPSQRFMSTSVSTFNVEGQSIDGVSTTITVRLADRQGNPVEDGTVINFTASGGQVASSCATQKINGIAQCSVLWQSQNPRPVNARVAVLAYTVGTKDYFDLDKTNTFSAGDQLVQMGDVFRDDDESGTFDPSIDGFFLGLNGTTACPIAGEPTPSTGSCDANLPTVVRQQIIILNSSSQPQPLSVANGNLVMFGTSSFTMTLRSAGGTQNQKIPLPAGTTISAAFASGPSTTCSVTSVSPSTVGNIPPRTVNLTNGSLSVQPLNDYPDLSTDHTVSLKTCASGDVIQVTVTPPSGSGSAYTKMVTLP